MNEKNVALALFLAASDAMQLTLRVMVKLPKTGKYRANVERELVKAENIANERFCNFCAKTGVSEKEVRILGREVRSY